MKRASLAQRLNWLQNGHEDDPEYNYARLKRLLDTTMISYFKRKGTAIVDLSRYLGLPAKEIEAMTYGDAVREIQALLDREGRCRKMGIEAVWVLAAPFIVSGKRRVRS